MFSSHFTLKNKQLVENKENVFWILEDSSGEWKKKSQVCGLNN
jgi:hypothetical protein